MFFYRFVSYKYLLTALFAVLISGCTSFTFNSTSDIKKPITDQRAYEYFTLANGLRVLVVSDPNTNQAAAAMNIAVGSGHDPQERQGLAHFLEHMLFLGTDKYPNAGDYQRFISEHGGNNNAYTSYDNTNYFFDVDEAYLAQALDRFSQFFIAPKLDEKYLAREKNAVHSEFHLSFKEDGRRSIDAIKSIINPAHPFSKFSTGNLMTLADRANVNIRDELLSFYHKYYFAKNMTLVILGKESVPQLKQLVVTRFANIPTDAKQPLKADDEPQATQEKLFLAGSLPGRLAVESIKDIYSLSLMFPVPNDKPFYKTNPLFFLSHLLGYEGQGSLLSELKRRGWAESLSAGGGISFASGSLFPVDIILTKKGHAHVDEIITLFFQTVKRIEKAGIAEHLYAEQSQISRVTFDYREAGRAYDYVSRLARSLLYYAPQDVLYGPYMMEQYDAALITDMLGYLRPDNLLVLTMSQHEKTDLLTSWYQTPYTFEAVEKDALALWQAATMNEKIMLPRKNPYLVEDLSLVKHQAPVSEPVVIKDTQQVKVWQLPNNLLQQPKSNVFVRFQADHAGQSAKHVALNSLYALLLNDAMNEESYDAYLTGLSLAFESHLRGLTLRVDGFSDKQALLMQSALKQIQQTDIDALRFESLKKEYQLSIENRELNKPYSRVYSLFQSLIQIPSYLDEELLIALDQISVKDMQSYIDHFWQRVDAQVLINGNVDKAQALAISRSIETLLSKAAVTKTKVGVVKLPAAQTREIWSIDTTQTDYAYLLYIQGEDASVEERAAFMLTAQMLEALFYFQLRTEQQLGYLVRASYLSNLGLPGMSFLIQSTNAAVPLLDKAVDLFMRHAYERFVNKLTEEDFDKNKAAVKARLLMPPTSLYEQSSNYWQRIALNEAFDLNQQIVEQLDEISFEQWKQFFAKRFDESKLQRSLKIGTTRDEQSKTQDEQLQEWKSQQQVHWLK